MKRKVLAVIGLVLVVIVLFLGQKYIADAKIADAVVTTTINDEGKPKGHSEHFTTDDTIYVAAKGTRFWVDEADIVWYKGEIRTKNRFVENRNVEKNDAGYYVAELVAPEGLEAGTYGVAVFVAGENIIETKVEFTVK